MANKRYPATLCVSLSAPKMKIGDRVKLVAEPDNVVDSSAVAAYVVNNDDSIGGKIGYLAATGKTILPGSMTAASIQKKLLDEKVAGAYALLVSGDDFVNAAGESQNRFLADVFWVPARKKEEAEEKAEEEEKVTVSVGGSIARCPRRTSVLQALSTAMEERNNGSRADLLHLPVTVKRYEAANAVSYRVYEEDREGDEFCGEIKAKDAKALSDMFGEASSLRGVTTGEFGIVGNGQNFDIEVSPVSHESSGEIDEAIDLAIAHCAGQKKELEEKAEFIRAQGGTESMIRYILENMRPQDRNFNIPDKPERPYMSSKKTLPDVLAFMLHRKPIRLIGEKGSGKNTLIDTVCWLLNQPVIRIQGSVELDKMDLLGSPQLYHGETCFQLSPAMSMLASGGSVVIDEANLVRPDVLGLLHSVTDGARSILVPGYGRVDLAETSSVFYTLNENYTGTGEMNEATVDRCVTFELEPETDLKYLLSGYPADQVSAAQRVSDAVRKAVEDGTLPSDAITVRGYIDALELSDLVPLKRALISCVAGKVQDKSLRNAIIGIIENEVA